MRSTRCSVLGVPLQCSGRAKDGQTSLMCAAATNPNPDVITELLKAGAIAKLKSNISKTAYGYAGENEKVKGADAFWELKKATF